MALPTREDFETKLAELIASKKRADNTSYLNRELYQKNLSETKAAQEKKNYSQGLPVGRQIRHYHGVRGRQTSSCYEAWRRKCKSHCTPAQAAPTNRGYPASFHSARKIFHTSDFRRGRSTFAEEAAANVELSR